eukprot:UN22628
MNQPFHLKRDEYIIGVDCINRLHENVCEAVQLLTSTGRRSPWYGTYTAHLDTKVFKSEDGMHIIGLQATPTSCPAIVGIIQQSDDKNNMTTTNTTNVTQTTPGGTSTNGGPGSFYNNTNNTHTAGPGSGATIGSTIGNNVTSGVNNIDTTSFVNQIHSEKDNKWDGRVITLSQHQGQYVTYVEKGAWMHTMGLTKSNQGRWKLKESKDGTYLLQNVYSEKNSTHKNRWLGVEKQNFKDKDYLRCNFDQSKAARVKFVEPPKTKSYYPMSSFNNSHIPDKKYLMKIVDDHGVEHYVGGKQPQKWLYLYDSYTDALTFDVHFEPVSLTPEHATGKQKKVVAYYDISINKKAYTSYDLEPVNYFSKFTTHLVNNCVYFCRIFLNHSFYIHHSFGKFFCLFSF